MSCLLRRFGHSWLLRNIFALFQYSALARSLLSPHSFDFIRLFSVEHFSLINLLYVKSLGFSLLYLYLSWTLASRAFLSSIRWGSIYCIHSTSSVHIFFLTYVLRHNRVVFERFWRRGPFILFDVQRSAGSLISAFLFKSISSRCATTARLRVKVWHYWDHVSTCNVCNKGVEVPVCKLNARGSVSSEFDRITGRNYYPTWKFWNLLKLWNPLPRSECLFSRE